MKRGKHAQGKMKFGYAGALVFGNERLRVSD